MAEGYLVDTGVFVRWFVPQAGWEHARQVRDDHLAGLVMLHTVDLVRVEVGHVLRKVGLLRGLLDGEQYAAAVRAIDDLDVVVHVSDVDALERAARLATARMVGFYDALIAERALGEDLVLLTTDAKLCRAVDGLVRTQLLIGATPA